MSVETEITIKWQIQYFNATENQNVMQKDEYKIVMPCGYKL